MDNGQWTKYKNHLRLAKEYRIPVDYIYQKSMKSTVKQSR